MLPATNSGRDKKIKMESRITIDVDIEGQPQIRIDFSTKGEDDDVRDKLIGRMVNHLYPGAEQREITMDFGHEHTNGMVAFVRFKKDSSTIEKQNAICCLWRNAFIMLPPDDITVKARQTINGAVSNTVMKREGMRIFIGRDTDLMYSLTNPELKSWEWEDELRG